MKRLRNASLACMIPALAVLGVHLWITPLPDWAVRLCGIVLLCGVFALSFSTVRLQIRK